MKKGQSILIVWIIATLIIIFLSLIYILLVLSINTGRVLSFSKSGSIFLKDSIDDPHFVLQENLENFLNMPITYNGKMTSMYEFIDSSSGGTTDSAIFVQNANSFFPDLFSNNLEGAKIEVTSNLDRNNVLLEAGDFSCNLLGIGDNIVYVYFTKTKVIDFCVNRAYYDSLEGLKYEPNA